MSLVSCMVLERKFQKIVDHIELTRIECFFKTYRQQVS